MVSIISAECSGGETIPLFQGCSLKFCQKWIEERFTDRRRLVGVKGMIKKNARACGGRGSAIHAVVIHVFREDGELCSKHTYVVENDKLDLNSKYVTVNEADK